jgi:aspartyl-tRNA(Asn)/glutamyl-tRNA(Gln) amidotransferase subunit B
MSSLGMDTGKGTGWEVVIGLEVHCQLATRTKLFCGCANRFGEPPNTLTCPVCTGAPGALPVLNAEAVRLALRAGLALGCTIDRASRFDRKNYFYCDLPKGYQTTQYARPIASGGGVALPEGLGGRTIRLTRIHLEEDAGKAIHDRGPETLVDLNRAGVPLIEIVSEADLRSPAEAQAYLEALKETLRWTGVSDCDMEKGSLRCDVNVSLHRPGTPLGTKIELKNLNSFRNVGLALEHEIERQRAALEGGQTLRQETRLWDVAAGATRVMRVKEDADDYRYFPEPDLPPAVLSEEQVRAEQAALPEPPAQRRARWCGEHGLSQYDAGVLSASRELADFFEATARTSGRPKEAANWIANELLALLRDPALGRPALETIALTPARLAQVIGLVDDGTVNRAGARDLLRVLLGEDVDAGVLVERLGLALVSDAGELESWCRAAIAARPAAAADARAGQAKALGALIGPVMAASKGRADPKTVRATLQRLLAEEA